MLKKFGTTETKGPVGEEARELGLGRKAGPELRVLHTVLRSLHLALLARVASEAFHWGWHPGSDSCLESSLWLSYRGWSKAGGTKIC